MAVAQHTEWERKQLESIELFLKQAIQAIDYFTETNTESLRETESDEDIDRSADWLKFRGIVLDLYSVLDYVWYLLYCHFSNGGEPDFSDKGCELGFPYKKRGIKCSTTPERDQTGKFVKEKLKMIWGDKIGEETHFWKEIGAVILNVQPKMIVGRSGAPETGKVVIQPGDEESFALLHYYRNCAAHKDLIRFMLRNSVIEIDQSTRVTRLVTSTERRDDCFYMELDRPGFWIQLPSLTSISEPSRLLVDVLTQLRKFVVSTASQLLRSALLLPSAKNILEHHIEGMKLTPTSQNQHEVTITATMKDGTQIEKTATNESKVYAEEDACVKIMKSLPTGVVPNSPYSCFTQSYYVSSLPQVQILERMPDGTCVKLLDDWKKKLEAGNVEVLLEYDKHFLVRSKLKPSGEVIFKLGSEMLDGPSADKAKETAADKLITEGLRLGLIEVKQLDWPPSLVQTLTKVGNKTYRMVLNEYRQRLTNLNMVVNLDYDEPREVGQSTFETKLSLTVSQKDSGDNIFRISSSIQRGRAKNESKEAAAQEVVVKCQNQKIIMLNSHEE
jgi:hypothetical protein